MVTLDSQSTRPRTTIQKFKMNFTVFNMKKEETQMSYHMIHGQERRGLLIDPGAASGLVGRACGCSRAALWARYGKMEINRNKITPASGISGNSESTLGEVTLTMATAGQPITGVGSSCPALAGNPTLRGLWAWFENGDGLNTKDQEAMDTEVTHVKLLQDPPHRFWTLHPTMQQRSEGSKIDLPQKAKGRIP